MRTLTSTVRSVVGVFSRVAISLAVGGFDAAVFGCGAGAAVDATGAGLLEAAAAAAVLVADGTAATFCRGGCARPATQATITVANKAVPNVSSPRGAQAGRTCCPNRTFWLSSSTGEIPSGRGAAGAG